MHRPATLFACRAWVPIIFSLSLLCSKMCSTGKPKERFLVARTGDEYKLGLHLQKAGFFDVDGWISPCSRHGRVVLDEGREGRIPPATSPAASRKAAAESRCCPL